MKKVFLVFLLFVGCSQIAVNNRVDELKEILNPMIGTATQRDIIGMFGLPERKEKIGDTEYWYIKISYGQRGSVYATSSLGLGKSWESFDELTLGFISNGILNMYKFYVQR